MTDSVSHVLLTRDLASGYGTRQVLNGVSVELRGGEMLAVLGQNGSGKSTLLKTLFGTVSVWSGEVMIHGRSIEPRPSLMLDLGVAYSPQGNRVFGELSVKDNLEVGCQESTGRKEDIRSVLERFPPLADRLSRKAATLSGGEKQMLALARVLLRSPSVLLLDEPSLGLSPGSARGAFKMIRGLCAGGMAVMLVEQRVREALEYADRVIVLRTGEVAFCGTASDLGDDLRLREVLM